MREKFLFDVTGMSCAACASRVERAAKTVAAVDTASVNLLRNTMTVSWNEAPDTDALCAAVREAGYGVTPRDPENKKNAARISHSDKPCEDPNLRLRLIVSLALCVFLLTLTMGPKIGIAIPESLSGLQNAPKRTLTALILTLSVLILNQRFYTSGLAALWRLSPNMDSLVALGSAAALIHGLYTFYAMLSAPAIGDAIAIERAANNLYFDSAAMIVTLVSVGKYFEARAKRHTTGALTELMTLIPEKAVVLDGNEERIIDISKISVGTRLMVRTGERIAADGIIARGLVSVDESAVTGESTPADKTLGATVSAGTLVTSGWAEVCVKRAGADTTLAQIVRLVDEATASKTPVQRLADRVAGVFVPVVMGIALITVLFWGLSGHGWDFALVSGISVLVISCPCSLGLATPTAVMVAAGRGAKAGILFKNAAQIEALANVTTVVFDKTGTLTEGKPVLTDVIPVNGQNAKTVLSLAASVEVFSEHPIGRALVRCAKDNGLKFDPVLDFQQSPGRVEGLINGTRVVIGNGLVLTRTDPTNDAIMTQLAKDGKTPLAVLVDGTIAGILATADSPRPEAAQVVNALKNRGLKVMMLTGDNAVTAKAVADFLGIDRLKAGVTPSDKQTYVTELEAASERVLMIGDGVNDAPSLAAATAGMAVFSGTDLAAQTAGILLRREGLDGVIQALDLAKATLSNIRQNLFWAFFYNALAIPLAAGLTRTFCDVTLSPMVAAAAMSLSSLTVVTNALRLRNHPMPNFMLKNAPNAFTPFKLQQTEENNMITKMISIEGMHCPHCSGAVTKALQKLAGVQSVDVSLEKKEAIVVCDILVTDKELTETVTRLDFEVKAIRTV